MAAAELKAGSRARPAVDRRGNNVGVTCRFCERRERDAELVRLAVDERAEALHDRDLSGELRDLIENEELALEDLLARILEHSAGA